jgi:hypothetical protein
MIEYRKSAPKADALPGCATPRPGVFVHRGDCRNRDGRNKYGQTSDGGPGRTRTRDLAVMSGQL